MSNTRSAVLLLGADPYTVRACLKNGFTPVVLHSPQNNWGAVVNDWGHMAFPKEAEVVFVEDPTSLECVLSSLHRSGNSDRNFRCVQTSSEEALVTAAALGGVLGVASITPSVAVNFRDKWLQKMIVSEAGIEVAKSYVIEDVYDPDLTHVADFDKAVLKPIAGGGTRNTSIILNREELITRCLDYRRGKLDQRTFVLEEYVDGEEWVVDGVIFNGEIQFFCVGAYSEPCLSVVNANTVMRGERFDPVADAWVYELARPLTETSLRALGLRDGVFHLELFHRNDTGKLVFGECAARRGGGLTHEVVECKFGVDLGEAAVLCAAGIDPQVEPSIHPGTVGSTFLAHRPGTLVRYPAPSEIQALPGVEHVRLELPYGSQMASVADTIGGVGQVVLSGKSREEFHQRCDTVTHWFDERLVVVPPSATNQDLRVWQSEHWPESSSFFPTYSNERLRQPKAG